MAERLVEKMRSTTVNDKFYWDGNTDGTILWISRGANYNGRDVFETRQITYEDYRKAHVVEHEDEPWEILSTGQTWRNMRENCKATELTRSEEDWREYDYIRHTYEFEAPIVVGCGEATLDKIGQINSLASQMKRYMERLIQAVITACLSDDDIYLDD